MSPFHFRLAAAKNLSSFQLLPASLFTDLLQLFLGLLLFLFPWGFQSSALFGISPSSFLNVWPIHLNFLFLISTFISSCLVTFHRSLLEIIFGNHILNIYLRHLFTKVCSLRWIFFVTSQVAHPYKSTDFTQAKYKDYCKQKKKFSSHTIYVTVCVFKQTAFNSNFIKSVTFIVYNKLAYVSTTNILEL